MDISFYHLTRVNVQKSLPKLLEKIVQKPERVVLSLETEAAVGMWNDLLWTYHPQSFLPHGTAKEGFSDAHPIWITTGVDRPNGATILMRLGLQPFGDVEALKSTGFQKIIHVFEMEAEEGLKGVRGLWQHYQSTSSTPVYWQQGVSGEWSNHTAHLVGVA